VLPTPTKFTLLAGSGEAKTPLTAFDEALLVAGLGNLNLLRVSSILPPGSTYVETLSIPEGSLTPTAYGEICSDIPGETIAAAVAVGIGVEGESEYGVIMEYSGRCSAAEAEQRVREMAREALEKRGRRVGNILSKGAEHRVKNCGCALAAVALWY